MTELQKIDKRICDLKDYRIKVVDDIITSYRSGRLNSGNINDVKYVMKLDVTRKAIIEEIEILEKEKKALQSLGGSFGAEQWPKISLSGSSAEDKSIV